MPRIVVEAADLAGLVGRESGVSEWIAVGQDRINGFADVTDEAAWDTIVERALESTVRIDVLVNNAGLGGTAHIVEMTDEQWEGMVRAQATWDANMAYNSVKALEEREVYYPGTEDLAPDEMRVTA